jgi:RNA polymerase-binding transcription factor
MKKRLEEKQAELQANLAGLTEAHPQPVDPVEAMEGAPDPEEVAVDATELEQEQAIEANERALLTEVQAALQRIEDGTYGQCAVCGRPIPEKRLEAIPWATLDVEHEAALEQRNLADVEYSDEG